VTQASANIQDDRGPTLPSSARARARRAQARWTLVSFAAALVAGGALWLGQRSEAPDSPIVQDLVLPAAPAATDAAEPVAGPGAQFAAAASAAMKPLEAAVDVIVRRDDTLDGIFRRLQLSVTDLAAIRQLPGIRQSLDLLRPGDVISLTHLNGEVTSLQRRVSDTETLQVARTAPGAYESKIVENALEVRTVPVHGRITSSLFKAINDAGADDGVALQLAEVFRYDVDFAQELQRGDTFTLVLEKVWRDGEFLRDGDIVAAEFVNNGRTYRAVRYTTPDGRSEYYTPDGKSLRKAFLRAPLQFTRISSGFGMRRHPVLNTMRAHKGVDYAAPVGTPIRAAGDGRITFRGVKGGYGNVIVLSHSGGVETLYAHMHRFAKGVFVGKRVKQGELIGYVGMTGLASGPHLHYEYRVNGVHRNPSSIKTMPVEPLHAKYRADFDAKTQALLAQLGAARHTATVAAAN
jgi:murein DD-endopeptidase MepM/ murein hydrolase activator NlpD